MYNYIEKDTLLHKGSKVDWINSVGRVVTCVYDNETYEVKIVRYFEGQSKLLIESQKRGPFIISTHEMLHCSLGRFLGKFTSEFKVEIGAEFHDKDRDIIIMDREYRKMNNKENKDRGWNTRGKWYEYICNKCSTTDWILESSLLKGGGCSVCNSTSPKPLLGYNTVWDLDPYTTKAIGYELARKRTCSSEKDIVYPVCPVCGRQKEKPMKISTIHYNQSIGCPFCSDGISYPNKLLHNIVKFYDNRGAVDEYEFELDPEWAEGKIYDCYIYVNGKDYLIEMDGGLGHGKRVMPKAKKNVEQSILIDEFKDSVAIDNLGVQPIRIGCDYPTGRRLESIKNNILKSDLRKIFDLSLLNWEELDNMSQNSLVIEACKIKKNNPLLTTTEIANMMDMKAGTIARYLKKGAAAGWCEYDPVIERKRAMKKVAEISRERDSKPIRVILDGECVGEFPSMAELSLKSRSEYGKYFPRSVISKVCNGLKKQCKGYSFEFISDSNNVITLPKAGYDICDYKNKNPESTTTEIAKVFGKNRTTVIEYLIKGTKNGICNYNPNDETKRRVEKLKQRSIANDSKKVSIYKDKVLVGEFDSGAKLEEASLDIFGVKLYRSGISRACNGKSGMYKGYVIRFS
ncbi:MAG: hypothetical protein Q4F05_05050 [bacterium]|nr:hypothetical protein [bacterium]